MGWNWRAVHGFLLQAALCRWMIPGRRPMNKEIRDESNHGGRGRFGGWPVPVGHRARTGVGDVGPNQSQEHHRHHTRLR